MFKGILKGRVGTVNIIDDMTEGDAEKLKEFLQKQDDRFVRTYLECACKSIDKSIMEESK